MTTVKPAVGVTDAERNAYADVQNVLGQYGLSSLASWAWTEIIKGAGNDQVLFDLMKRPEFQQRFPAIALRQKAGLAAISPADYVNYENSARQMMRAAGLPSSFYDQPSDFTDLLTKDVSLNELSQRVDLAKQAVYQVPQETRNVLARDYGIDAGHLAAFMLNPNVAQPLLEKKFNAAQIGGAAVRAGYGTNRTQDEYLAGLGVTPQQATSGFDQLVQSKELFQSLPGENTTGVSEQEQLQAAFGGDANAQAKVEKVAAQRKAQFQEGGGFASSSTGLSGLGTAQGV